MKKLIANTRMSRSIGKKDRKNQEELFLESLGEDCTDPTLFGELFITLWYESSKDEFAIFLAKLSAQHQNL